MTAAAYLRSLGHWIRGNLDWQTSTGRYGTSHAIHDHPATEVGHPLPIRTIAWWWDDRTRPGFRDR